LRRAKVGKGALRFWRTRPAQVLGDLTLFERKSLLRVVWALGAGKPTVRRLFAFANGRHHDWTDLPSLNRRTARISIDFVLD
jgi:hypothetical protein